MPAALLPTQPRRAAASFGTGSKGGKSDAGCGKQSAASTTDGSWNIKALFRQPRRLLRRPAGCPAAELPTEASSSRLQHAVSIAPLTGDSLDGMLLGSEQKQRAGSRSRQRSTAARSASPSSRAAHAGSSAAGHCSPPDALDAAIGMAMQAARARCTADPAVKLAAAQQEAQHLQGRLSECEAQLAAVQRQVEHAETAAEGLPTAELERQALEVEHELKAMDSHFEAEVHRLAAATRAARRRTAALQAAAQEQVALAGSLQRRVELMEDTHEPLNRAEQEKRHRLEAQFRFKVVRFSSDA